MKNFLTVIALTLIVVFGSFCYYTTRSIHKVNSSPVRSVSYPRQLIEKEKALRQELKQENEELKKQVEEERILIQTWNKKEKHCDDLQLKYNQIYLIVNQ